MARINVVSGKTGIEITAESVSGELLSGVFDLYNVSAETEQWIIDLAYTKWDNSEAEIVVKGISSGILSPTLNRLRMGISNCSLPNYPNAKMCTLRMASLKKKGTSMWANLKNVSIGELTELTILDPVIYFKKLGGLCLNYKADLFNQRGSGSKQLVLIFPKDNVQVPIHAFVLTRILPFFANIENPK